MNYWKITSITAIILSSIFCIFVFFNERYAHNEAQAGIEKHALVIADSLWNFNFQGSSEYLSLVCKSDNYKNLVVTDTQGEIFQEAVAEKPGSLDSLFVSLNLISEVPLISDIVHDGKTIGRIKVIWYCDTIYLQISVLSALIMIIVIVHLNARLLNSKHMLEVRVYERTTELNDLNTSLQYEVEEHRQAREELRKSEERFRVIFEQAAVGVSLCNSMTGEYIRVNKKYCDIIGYSQQEISKRSFQDITHPDDLQEDLDNMRLLLNGTIQNFTMEKRYFRKDGSIVWVKITVSPMWKHGDDAKFHIAIVEDITEHKKIEEAVLESEAKYRDLAGSLPEIVFETDVTGNLTFVNQNAFDLFGYTKEEFDKGLQALQMITPEDHNRAAENIQKILNGDIPGGLEYTALRKNGTTFPVVIHSNRFMVDNKPMGLRGLIIDLSKSKKMETDIKRRAMAMDQSTETIVITDTQGLVAYVNPAFEKQTGYSPKEVLGKKPKILQSGEHDEMFYHELWQTISKGKTWSGHFINKKKDGTQYTEEATISPVFSDRGEIVNYVAVKHDISNKLKLEAQLQQSQRMEAVGTLAGGIAHDFNNILSGIFGFSQLAKRHLENPEKAGNDIDQIIKGAQKAADLVQQILTVSRKSTHQKQPVSVYFIVREALKLLRATIPATIEIKEDIVSRATMMADPVKIHQVIMNLCTNAFHAMSETGGCLSVGLKEIEFTEKDCIPELNVMPGNYLKLEVADTGQGIDSLIIKKIFDPYFTTKEPGKGTGLGLAMVFGIVEEHKGHVSVYSEPGQGSTFYVYLPITDKGAAPSMPKDKEDALLSGTETIMFVDDEEALRKVTQELLNELGYTVNSFSSGAEAFETYKKDPNGFDLVVTDMTMPGMTGLELSQKILELRPGQPVVLCTGHSETINREKAVSMGISEYFEKPMITKELAKAMRLVLDKAKGVTQR